MFADNLETCHCIWAGVVLPGCALQVRLNEGKGVKNFVSAMFLEGEPTHQVWESQWQQKIQR